MPSYSMVFTHRVGAVSNPHGIGEVGNDASEWLWLNVLTREDVEDGIESLRVLSFC
jgi:hypothetical protein